MLYLFSVAVILVISFSTIVWRIRTAEREEIEAGGPGNNDSIPGKGTGSYIYTVKKDEGGSGTMMLLQTVS